MVGYHSTACRNTSKWTNSVLILFLVEGTVSAVLSNSSEHEIHLGSGVLKQIHMGMVSHVSVVCLS